MLETIVNSMFSSPASQDTIQFVFLVLMLAAVEAGFRLGRNAGPSIDEKTRPQISTVAGALLAVLGLLLGFTMTMAVSRYESRKQLVLEEANAIGTSYLRTKLLPPPNDTEIANLLREYVDVRLQYADVGDDLNRLKPTREEAARLQHEFWSRAVSYAQKDPNPVRAGLLLQSLNQVIDLESARWKSFNDHIPNSVIYVDGFVGVLAGILVGYTFGLAGQRQIFSMCLLAVAVTVVLCVIIDLDRPRQGFIRVSQQPMIDLQRQLRTVNR